MAEDEISTIRATKTTIDRLYKFGQARDSAEDILCRIFDTLDRLQKRRQEAVDDEKKTLSIDTIDNILSHLKISD